MSEYSPSGGATSARLRQVEAELHDALRRAADLEQVRAELTEAKALTDIFVQDNQRLEAERAERVDASFALKDELDEARAEAAEMRAQLLKATEQNEVLRQEITAAMRQLAGIEQREASLRAELRSAYTRLGDTEADRDRLRRDLAGAVVARHAMEMRIIACFRCAGPLLAGQDIEPQPGTTKGSWQHRECPDPTPTEES